MSGNKFVDNLVKEVTALKDKITNTSYDLPGKLVPS